MKIKLQGPKGFILPFVLAVGLTTWMVWADSRPQLGPSKVTNPKSSGIELLSTLPDPPGALSHSAPRPPAPTSKLSRPDSATQARVSRAYGQLPLHFEANHGQADAKVKFLSRGKGYTLFLNQTEAVYVSIEPKEKGRVGRKKARGKRKKRSEALGTILRMKLVDANSDARIIGQDQLPGKSNYFIGNDPTKWRTNIPHYAKVKQEEIYPGIDLVFYGNQRQLEYDFVVSPGADPGIIKLAFDGVNEIEIDDAGDLVLQTATGPIHMRKPLIYQEVNGARKEVPGGYVLLGAEAPGPQTTAQEPESQTQTVGFRVAPYDKSKSLVIDPVLVYSTFLGGTGDDTGWGIAVDSSGNAFVTGNTLSSNFPTEGLGIDNRCGGDQSVSCGGFFDVFVSQLNAAGTQLLVSTYLGGSRDDSAYGIALDAAGKVYITGETKSDDFPTFPEFGQIVQRSHAAPLEFDAFVAKLDPLNSTIVYSTYLGGSNGDDSGFGIAVDASGRAYVTGETDSFDFPVVSAFQTTLAGHSDPQCSFGGAPFDCSDAFVARLNSTGSELEYSTFLGGDGFDEGLGIAVDSSNNAYVTGETCSTNFPTKVPFQANFGGGPCSFVVVDQVGAGDAFVTKLDPQGSALVFSTYLGGSGDESGIGIAVDGSGNAYVTGFTPSVNFPTKNPIQPLLPSNSGSAFVTKLSSIGELVYSTFLGGTGSQQTFNIPFFSIDTASSVRFDIGVDIAVDSSGNAYIVGATGSGDLPTTIGSSQPDLDLQLDAFVIKLDPMGTVIRYSTYIGGSDVDIGLGIALDSQSNAYVTGSTFSTDFPFTPGVFQTVNRRGTCDLGQFLLCEAFVVKLSGVDADQPPLQFVDFPTVFTSLPSQGEVGVPFVGNIGIGGGFPPYFVETTQGTNPPPGLKFGSPVLSGTPNQAGLFQFVVQVTDDIGNVISRTFTIDFDTDPVISVVPVSRDFGSVAVGSSADRSFTVQNTGGGTLTGSASTSAPFSIVPDGSYSLGPGASQVVTVRFSPTTTGPFSGNVTFTGGGGFTAAVTGTGVPPTQTKLSNISTRGLVQTGDNVQIGGFIIGGTGPKTVLIRARGPVLTDFGVPGVLDDPFLQLFSGQTVIADNDNWETTSTLCQNSGLNCGGAAEITATGLDPCVGNLIGCSREAAILVTLDPGPYTAIVSGAGGSTGVGLVEVFEVGTSTSRLTNISTRGVVGTGDDVMIGGFIIGGTDPKTVLVRARGPVLTDFGVPGELSDPLLQLFSGQTVIAQNDNWQVSDPLCGSPAVSCGGQAEIVATGQDPCVGNLTGCAQESAVLITLPPGPYTAIVSGVGGGTGVGLVEVFEVNGAP